MYYEGLLVIIGVLMGFVVGNSYEFQGNHFVAIEKVKKPVTVQAPVCCECRIIPHFSPVPDAHKKTRTKNSSIEKVEECFLPLPGSKPLDA